MVAMRVMSRFHATERGTYNAKNNHSQQKPLFKPALTQKQTRGAKSGGPSGKIG